jgi:hypothetical protein
MGVLTKHMFEAPIPPSQVPGPARELGALEDVTLKALAKRPEDRYQSMDELVADLDRIVRFDAAGIPLLARRVDGLHRPDFSRVSMPGGAPMANLADELEPPARFEVSVRDSGGRGDRVRTVGLTVLVLLVIAGCTVGAVSFLRARPRGGEPISASNASNVSTASTASTASNAASAAPSVETSPSANRTPTPPPSTSASMASSTTAAPSVTPSTTATVSATASTAISPPIAATTSAPTWRPPSVPPTRPATAPSTKPTARPTGDIEDPFR